MSSRNPMLPRPRTDEELMRDFDKRIGRLETKPTVRVGSWVMQEVDGKLLAIGPGNKALDVGAEGGPVEVDLSSVRGDYVTPEELEEAEQETTNLASKVQEVVNKSWEAIFSDEEGAIDRTADDLANALKNIPAINVIAQTGANMVDTVTDIIDSFWRGLTRQGSGSNKSTADVANAAQITAEQADTGLQLAEWNNAILGIRNNKSLMQGMDETEESNFLLSEMMDGNATPPLISATSASHPMAFWRATEDSTKGFISWMGRGITNVTGLFIDIYRADFNTNTWVLLHSSTDQIGQFAAGTAMQLGIYLIPEASRFQVVAGDVIGVAWRVTGTGTHEIAGKNGSWLPAHPTVHPQRPAATRSGAPGNLAFGSTTYVGNTPWFGIGIATGDIVPPFFAPRRTDFTEVGTFVYQFPLSATHIDVVLCGAGQGGQGGSTIVFEPGEGGLAGEWIAETLVRGVDFPADLTELSITVGDGGFGGGAGSFDGGAGGASVRAAIAGGKGVLLATGGYHNQTGGGGANSPDGEDAGDFSYNGVTYLGGKGGIAKGGSAGRPGTSPGAGASGGSGGTWGVAWSGGKGGRGAAYCTARQA